MACEKCKKRKELEDKFLKHLEENVQKVFEDPKWKQDVLKANPDGMGRCSGVGEGMATAKACEAIGKNPKEAGLLTRTMLVGQTVAESTGIYSTDFSKSPVSPTWAAILGAGMKLSKDQVENYHKVYHNDSQWCSKNFYDLQNTALELYTDLERAQAEITEFAEYAKLNADAASEANLEADLYKKEFVSTYEELRTLKEMVDWYFELCEFYNSIVHMDEDEAELFNKKWVEPHGKSGICLSNEFVRTVDCFCELIEQAEEDLWRNDEA